MVTPEAGKAVTLAKVIGRSIKKGSVTKVLKLASINVSRKPDGTLIVKFTAITGPFTILFNIQDK